MIRKLWIWGLIVLQACDSNPEAAASAGGGDSLVTNPVPVEIDPGLLDKFSAVLALPVVEDSAFISHSAPADDKFLSCAEVRYLSYGYVESGITAESYHDFFCKTDSLRVAGMITDTKSTDTFSETSAVACGKMMIDDSTALLLWLIRDYHQEGCGISGVDALYASVMSAKTVTGSTILCAESHAGEAGYSSYTTCVLSVKTDGSAMLRTLTTYEEEDPESGELIIRTDPARRYQFVIANGTWGVSEVLSDEVTFR